MQLENELGLFENYERHKHHCGELTHQQVSDDKNNHIAFTILLKHREPETIALMDQLKAGSIRWENPARPIRRRSCR